MIPRVFNPSNPSPGEKHFFGKISREEDIDDWIVLHSLNIAHHQTRIMGEIDFLIVIPNKGILAIEIKAHHYIEVKDGRWFMGRGDAVGTTRSPFEQLNESLFSLQKYIANNAIFLKGIPVFPLTIFTHFEFITKSIEWNQKQIVSCKEYRKKCLSELLGKRLSLARTELASKKSAHWFSKNPTRPNKDDIKALLKLLRPSIEPLRQAAIWRDEVERDLLQFTTEQFDALDALADNPRVLFNGAAGTGKTFIAIESAVRAANSGQKVLLVCMNKFLSDMLKERLGKYSITVSTLHALMRSYDDGDIKNSSDYWLTELPQTAYLNMLDELKENELYDLLIIDEGQDIISNEPWLDCLDITLKNGLSQGCWYIFGDFDYQSIYSRGLSNDDLISNLKERSPTFTPYKLRKNCRNLKPAANLSISLSAIESPYSSFLRKTQPIIDSKYWMYSSDKEQKKLVLQIIKNCLKEGFKGSDIVILSKVAELKCITHLNNMDINARPFVLNSNDLTYTSIHKFKGLEAPVIILTDFDEIESDEARKMLFTGASRSTDSVHYLFHKNIKRTLLSLISK